MAAVALAATACVEFEPPGAGVPTLDDVGSDGFAAVTVGRSHSCALTADGSALCWGSNEVGQLGSAVDTTLCRNDDRRVPCEVVARPVAGGLKFTRIVAGANHTCAIATSGRVYCWGDNEHGQLGDPAVRQAFAPTPIVNAALFVDIAAGDEHTCAIRSDDFAMCWGSNNYGELGLSGLGTGAAVPVTVQGGLRFASVAAGDNRTCARQPDGTGYCWGARWVLRDDDGTEVVFSQTTPARIPGTVVFQSLSVGGGTTCGLAVDGAAHCWEANPTGAIGDASTIGSQTPRQVATGDHFISLGAGASHACGISDSGVAWCWGGNVSGQLGASPSLLSRRCGPLTVPCVLSPIRVSGWRVFKSVSAGPGDHVCGITLSSNVYCWGAGSMGQLGIGAVGSTSTPTKIIAP